MTKRELNIIGFLLAGVLLVFCALCLVLAASMRSPRVEQEAAAVIVSTPRASIAPATTSAPTLTMTPTNTPRATDTPTVVPTITKTPTPRPTYPPNWVCYKSIGHRFEFMHPSNWSLSSEDSTGVQFYPSSDKRTVFIAILADFDLDKVSQTFLQDQLTKFESYPYTLFRRGTQGDWKTLWRTGYYFEFVLASQSDESYRRHLMIFLPYGNQALVLVYIRVNAPSFSANENTMLHSVTSSLFGTCP